MLYKIHSGTDVEKFQAQVNLDIDQGWELYGFFQVAPFTSEIGETQVMLYQPMILRESATDAPSICTV